MIRSSISAFVIVCLCFAILQIPGKPESIPLPSAEASTYEVLPLPAGNCPGGVCPLPSSTVSVVSAPMQMTTSAGNWAYPGEIRQHLYSGHGVDASGMSSSDAVALHSSLHSQSRVVSSSVVTYSQPRTVQFVRRTPIRTTVRAVASIRPSQRLANTVRGVSRVVIFRRCR